MNKHYHTQKRWKNKNKLRLKKNQTTNVDICDSPVLEALTHTAKSGTTGSLGQFISVTYRDELTT